MNLLKKAELVCIGKSDELFTRDHNAIEQMTGAASLNNFEIEAWLTEISGGEDWCRSHNSQFRMLIVPEKHAVYRDLLPNGVIVSDSRPAVQLQDVLNRDRTSVIYPERELMSGRLERRSYYRDDSHWSMFGGYIAYRLLADSLRGCPVIPENDIHYSLRAHMGDLGSRLGFEAEIAEFVAHKRHRQLDCVLNNEVKGRGNLIVYETPHRQLPTCVLLRDSASTYIIPHLAAVCSRLVALSSMTVPLSLLESESPDFVVLETVERFLGMYHSNGARHLPRDASAAKFLEAVGMTVGEVRRATLY